MFAAPRLLLSTYKSQNVRFMSKLNLKPWKEVVIPVPWGYVRGKWWGATNSRPVLCLHGWQDNCGSFDRLIPQLDPNLSYLALDSPGHGLSSNIPSGLYYYAESYVILARYLHHFFKWDKISFLGHSMGGLTSYTYSMIYSDCVDFAICLDGSKPMLHKNKTSYMGSIIDSFLRYASYEASKKESPSYTMDEIIKKVCSQHDNSVLPEYAHLLIERNITRSKKDPGKYYFVRDPRIKSGTLMNYPQDELVECAKNIQNPILIIKTSKGSYLEGKESYYEVINRVRENNKNCQHEYVEGTHHVHLNHPERVSGLINNFINKYNTEKRMCKEIDPGLLFKK